MAKNYGTYHDEAETVLHYMGDMTTREFAGCFGEIGISHTAVASWANGQRRPNTHWLMLCRKTYPPPEDWRGKFAQDMINLSIGLG